MNQGIFGSAQTYLSPIVPGLFISDWESSQDMDQLAANKIKAILTIETRSRNPQVLDAFKRAGIEYNQIYLNDDPAEPISKYFDITAEFIRKNRSENKNVLVNCWAGISRSVSIVINYITSQILGTCSDLDPQMTVDLVLTRLREHRPIAGPNSGFMDQLYQKAKEYKSNCKQRLSKISFNDKPTQPMSVPAANRAMQMGAQAASAQQAPPSHPQANIVYLTNADFDAQGNLINFPMVNGVVLFFSHGCGHCQRMLPEYEKFASLLSESPNIRAFAVDSGKHQDLMTRVNPAAFGFAIRGVPTVVSYNKGKFYSEYADDDPSKFRSSDSLLQYALGIGTQPVIDV